MLNIDKLEQENEKIQQLIEQKHFENKNLKK